MLENLNNILNKPVTTERTVYLMIEIRKYIENSNSTVDEWKTLKYWCDWIVHTRLDRKFAKETLSKMEKYIINNPGNKFHHSYFNAQFVSLENLRQQLYQFLKKNNLSTKITNIPPWDKFCKYLVEVLRECPLEKNNGLVRKFFFSKCEHILEAREYSIDWEVIFDGTRANLYGSVLRFENNK